MRLDVWMEGVDGLVGVLERDAEGALSFSYEPGLSMREGISLALPPRDKPYGDAACRAYFGNLVFENRELDRIREQYRIEPSDIAGILYHVGADCPGAISVMQEGVGPGKRPGIFPDDYEEVTSDALVEIVQSLHLRGAIPREMADPSPIAGVQPKIAVLVHEHRFYLPKAGSNAPTTHILKVSPQSDPAMTRDETALLNFARRLEIATTDCEYLTFSAQGSEIGAILSRRFDRVFEDGLVRRLHAEDFCQALGLGKTLKYERSAVEGGRRFSAAEIGRLSKMMKVPGMFRIEFLRQTIFNLAVGNTDNHAKNSSLIYNDGRAYLAPLYDVIPVMMDNKVTHELAFQIGEARYAEDVSWDNLVVMMSQLGLRKTKSLEKVVREQFAMIARHIEGVRREGSKGLVDALAAQLVVLKEATGIDFEIPERDYFPRAVRDENPAQTAWSTFS